MKKIHFLFKHASLAALVTLFLAVSIESFFQGFVTQAISFDSLLFLAMLLVIAWGLISWHINHFVHKTHANV